MRRGGRVAEVMACSVVEDGTWSGGRAECRNGGSRVAVECSDDDVAECRDEGCSAGDMVEPMMPPAMGLMPNALVNMLLNTAGTSLI